MSRKMLAAIGIALAMFALLTAQIGTGLGAILAVYGFTSIAATIAYPQLTALFPPELTARVMTACNVLNFLCAFVFQWGVGAVLKLYPVANGVYAAEGYRAAFLVLGALQAVTGEIRWHA